MVVIALGSMVGSDVDWSPWHWQRMWPLSVARAASGRYYFTALAVNPGHVGK